MLPFLTTISVTLKHKRTCPKCGRGQVVNPSKKNESLPCKFCAESISPKRNK